jgi:GYF domain 2
MITVPGYMVMGEDGKEYGPATPEEIRRWVAEGRMSQKTPVKHTEGRDWTFLKDIAEFKDLFAPPPAPLPKKPAARREFIITGVFVAVLFGLYFLLKHYSHH